MDSKDLNISKYTLTLKLKLMKIYKILIRTQLNNKYRVKDTKK